jgi:hypothetical protein
VVINRSGMKDSFEVKNFVVVESTVDSHVVLLLLLSLRTAMKRPGRAEPLRGKLSSLRFDLMYA